MCFDMPCRWITISLKELKCAFATTTNLDSSKSLENDIKLASSWSTLWVASCFYYTYYFCKVCIGGKKIKEGGGGVRAGFGSSDMML